MVQIAESASKLTAEFKRKHGSIDWQAINGMRNRIVHDFVKALKKHTEEADNEKRNDLMLRLKKRIESIN